MGKRGRPPKKSGLIDPGSKSPQDPGSDFSPIKKRGRPPKTKLGIVQDLQSEPALPAGRRAQPSRHGGRARESASPNDKKLPTWSVAYKRSQTVSDQYSMIPAEQKLAFDVALTLKPGAVIVELGVTYGRTALILATAAQVTGTKYYGIDNFKMGSSPEEITEHLARFDLPAKIIKGDTQTVAWNLPIDCLLIDAGHDDLNMRQDTARWLPFLSPGGLVLFHAYNPDIDYTDPHFPVKRWAQERTEGWEEIAYIPYLLVKQKPI